MPQPRHVERVVILNDATDAQGGATGLATTLARDLAADGMPTTFVSGGGPDPSMAGAGVEMVTLDERPLLERNPLTAARDGLHHSGAAAMVAEWIRRNDRPGVVYHLHGWSKRLSPSIFAALRKVAPRVLVHAHDYFLICPNGAFMHYPAERPCGLSPLSAACVASACDRRHYGHKLWRVARQVALRRQYDMRAPWGGIALIHPAMRDRFVAAGAQPDRIHVIPNPVTPYAAGRISAAANRSLLFVGRLNEEKGVLDAAAAARRAGAPLVVVGDGPLRARLESEYPEVAVLGWLPHAAIGAVAAAARLLLVPSRYPEPFGLVIMEACRSGLPVVLTETALLAVDIDRLQLGRACNTRNPAAFAATIAELQADDDLVEAMSINGHAGTDGLALGPAEWRAALMARYEAMIAVASR